MQDYGSRTSFEHGWLAVVFVLLYIALFCLTRMQTDPQYIDGALHHFYTIHAFALVGAGFLLLPALEAVVGGGRKLTAGLAMAFLLLIFLQAGASHQVNRRMMAFADPERMYIKAIADFVREHGREQGFSFVIDSTDQRYDVPIRLGSDQKEPLTPLENLLFAKYITDKPKYYLVYNHDEGMRHFLSRADARAYQRIVKRSN